MPGAQKFLVRTVLLLVLIFGGGWLMCGVLNLAALFMSPKLVSMVQCPPGSTVQQDMKQQSYDHPGQKTMTFTCVNEAGESVKPLSNEESRAMEYKIFYPAGVAVMVLIVIVWFIVSALGKTKGTKAS